ncbi:MAG: NAD-dependent epimerase/dehydratase family protein [Deltaproteobacteria bacterium]|nr:NAD-dependent epimerase/dehydratase family protein [Deltaproteobacteria bacterium]MBW2008857.1 NAD-dependent epimerase/dehydratase family protein [Deltaproteobacteria bacterium]
MGLNLSEQGVVLTGGSGFLGKWLIRALLPTGARILSLDRRPLPDEWTSHARVKHAVLDLEDGRLLKESIGSTKGFLPGSSALIHLASNSHAGACHEDPVEACRANVILTVKALEACRSKGISRVLFSSTALVYGKHRPEDARETDAAEPGGVYAATKLAAEDVLRGYAAAYGFSCDILRFSNIYGPDVHEDTAVGTALRHAAAGMPIRLKTHTPVRDFLYCEDAAEAFVRLLAAGAPSGSRVVNVSTGKAHSIGEMAGILHEIAARDIPAPPPVVPEEVMESRLVLSNGRLYRYTGWRPRHDLQSGLQKTWEYMDRG